jgi:hypothetical protein
VGESIDIGTLNDGRVVPAARDLRHGLSHTNRVEHSLWEQSSQHRENPAQVRIEKSEHASFRLFPMKRNNEPRAKQIDLAKTELMQLVLCSTLDPRPHNCAPLGGGCAAP